MSNHKVEDTELEDSEEILDYARQLGIDPDTEPELLWLARKAFNALFFDGWHYFQSDDGANFYWNKQTGQLSSEDPTMQHYRHLVIQERERLQLEATAGGKGTKKKKKEKEKKKKKKKEGPQNVPEVPNSPAQQHVAMDNSPLDAQEATEPEQNTEEEILDYARQLGIDPDTEPELLWLAREAFNGQILDGWEYVQSDDGQIYYYNRSTDKSTWNDPTDDHYRLLVIQERERRHPVAPGSDESEEYTFSEEEILDYAQQLGIDPDTEPELLWLARKAIHAPMLDGWEYIKDQYDDGVYHNMLTHEFTEDDPTDEQFRLLVIQERERRHPVAPKSDESEEYTFSEEEILDNTRQIGIDPYTEPELLWLSRKAIHAPMLDGWEYIKDQYDDGVYHNMLTHEFSKDDPTDEQFRLRLIQEHERRHPVAPDFDESEEYTLSEEEILDYARQIGIDPDTEPELLSLARDCLNASMPNNWLILKRKEDDQFEYYNTLTNESVMEHPKHELHCRLVRYERERLQLEATTEGTETKENEKKNQTESLKIPTDNEANDVTLAEEEPEPEPEQGEIKKHVESLKSSDSEDEEEMRQSKLKAKENRLRFLQEKLDKEEKMESERITSEKEKRLRTLKENYNRSIKNLQDQQEEALQKDCLKKNLNSHLQEERKRLQDSNTAQLEKLHLELDAQMQKAQKTRSQKESELKNLSDQIELRAKELKSQETMLQTKAANLEKKKKKLGQEEDKVDGQIKALPQLQERVELKQELDKMREDYNQVREQSERLTEERDKAMEDQRKAKMKEHKLRQARDKAIEHMMKAKKEAESLRNERDKAIEDSRRANEDTDSKKDEIAKALEDNKRAKAKERMLRKERDKAKEEAESLRTERDKAKEEAESLRTERDKAKEEVESLRTERDKAKEEAESLRTERDKAIEETRRAKEETERLRNERDKALEDPRRANEEVDRLKKTIAKALEYKKRAEAKEMKLRKERDQAREDIRKAKEEAEILRNERDKAMEDTDSVKDELAKVLEYKKRAKAKEMKLRKERDQAREDIRKAKEEAEILRNERDKAMEDTDSVKDELAKVLEYKKRAKGKEMKLRKERDQAREDIRKAKEEAETQNNERNTTMEENSVAKKEIDKAMEGISMNNTDKKRRKKEVQERCDLDHRTSGVEQVVSDSPRPEPKMERLLKRQATLQASQTSSSQFPNQEGGVTDEMIKHLPEEAKRNPKRKMKNPNPHSESTKQDRRPSHRPKQV